MDWNLFTDIGVNAPILLLNSKVAITHFESDTRQLFETEEGSFIYFKDDKKLHKIGTEEYTKALLKCLTFIDYKTAEEQVKRYING